MTEGKLLRAVLRQLGDAADGWMVGLVDGTATVIIGRLWARCRCGKLYTRGDAVGMYRVCRHEPQVLFCRTQFQRELFAIDDLDAMRRWCATPYPEGDTVEDGGADRF